MRYGSCIGQYEPKCILRQLDRLVIGQSCLLVVPWTRTNGVPVQNPGG